MELKEFFMINSKVAIAFSGGVDSAYLLYEAAKSEADVRAYYFKGPFQPEFEFEDAVRFASELGVEMEIVSDRSLLTQNSVAGNPPDRCYYCKRIIFERIAEAAAKDGYFTICDGTNASDDADDRPGMRALRELEIRSPLRECGLEKTRIRELSEKAGLFTWDKPSYACLATRIPVGSIITEDKLRRIERAEGYLTELGFTDFRVRMPGERTAKLQLREEQLCHFVEKRVQIVQELRKYYDIIVLDAETRTSD